MSEAPTPAALPALLLPIAFIAELPDRPEEGLPAMAPAVIRSVPSPAPRRGAFLEASLHFALDRAELPPQGREVLRRWAVQFQTQGQAALSVFGHTDATGKAPHNLRLSLARARAVTQALQAQGLTVTRCEGLGSTQPIASNETVAGRARNRRVELRLESASSQGLTESEAIPEAPRHRPHSQK